MTRLLRIAFATAAVLAIFSGPAARADDQPVDPEALATARTILDVTHASALGDQVMGQMIKIFTASLNQANPGKAKEVSEILDGLLLPAFHESMPALLDESARTYARNFTAAELKQILAFYQSDVGRKVIERTPEMAREQMTIGQSFAQKIIADVRQKLLQAIKEKGLQAPQGI